MLKMFWIPSIFVMLVASTSISHPVSETDPSEWEKMVEMDMEQDKFNASINFESEDKTANMHFMEVDLTTKKSSGDDSSQVPFDENENEAEEITDTEVTEPFDRAEELRENVTIAEEEQNVSDSDRSMVQAETEFSASSNATVEANEYVTEDVTEENIPNELTIHTTPGSVPRNQDAKTIIYLLGQLLNKLEVPPLEWNNYQYITALRSADGSIFVPKHHRQSTRKHLATLLGFAEEIVVSKNALAYSDQSDNKQAVANAEQENNETTSVAQHDATEPVEHATEEPTEDLTERTSEQIISPETNEEEISNHSVNSTSDEPGPLTDSVAFHNEETHEEVMNASNFELIHPNAIQSQATTEPKLAEESNQVTIHTLLSESESYDEI